MTASWKLWRAELAKPTPEERRADRSTNPLEMTGYWRIQGARTKPDFPVAIWTEDGETSTIFQIGRKAPMNTITDENLWHEFVSGSWLKCVAVTKADWDTALSIGRWPDGKPARQLTDEEKADIIPTTPAEEGGNEPVDETGDIYEQVKAKLERAAERAAELGPINTMEKATAAAAIVETISLAGGIGERQRKEEKKPHDEAIAEIQGKWVPVLQPASELSIRLKKLIQKFKDDEAARLRREEEERRRKIEEEAREAERKRLAEEAAAKAAAGEQAPTAEEIEAQAQAAAEEAVAATPAADTSVRVGTAHGRGVTIAKRKVGKIIDADKFFAAVKGDTDIVEALQKKANALARAKVKMDGMEIVEE